MCDHGFVGLREGEWYCHLCGLFLPDHPDAMAEKEEERQRQIDEAAKAALEKNVKNLEAQLAQERWEYFNEQMKSQYMPAIADQLNKESMMDKLRAQRLAEDMYKMGPINTKNLFDV